MMQLWRRIRKKKSTRYVITFFAVLVSAIIQVFALQTFVSPANLLSGGFTGIGMLMEKVAALFGFQLSLSVALIILNLPVAFLCSKSINLKFTLFSLLQVVFASAFLKIFHFHEMFNDRVLNVIFGGVIYGFSLVLALRGNASTGGTDFIALYVSNKTGKSIWEYVFAGNVALLIIFGCLFGWKNAGYSIIFQYICTKTISAFHHRYERVTLQITTTKADAVIARYISECHHGISCVDAIGGYSKRKMYLLHTVISAYEENDIVTMIREVDEKSIINVFKTENFYGTFYQAPLE